MNTLECIKTRHSTRKFKADQVSRELIDQVPRRWSPCSIWR